MPDVVECPGCGFQLCRVDISPMSDEWIFYCDSCPHRVDVSFYDSIVNQIRNQLQQEGKWDYDLLMERIEDKLKPCVCGGHYKKVVARRCFNCNSEIIRDDEHGSMGRGIMLYPSIFCPDDDNLDLETQYIKFYEEYVLRKNIWKPL